MWIRACFLGVSLWMGLMLGAGPVRAEEDPDEPPSAEAGPDESIETIRITGRIPVTATSSLTVPAERFELAPLESGGQMLEAIPNLVTAQHTGGGKAEQYFIRGFDADHGTDLAVYFDGVPVNLRSHAHGQGFTDLHFITKESIARLDAYKGPYFARYGDFATAAAVEYVPFDTVDESFVKVEGGSFDTFRAVGTVTSGGGALELDGPAQGYLTFEAYHTDGPFDHPEDLWRYSALARGHVDVTNDLRLSGHILGYHASWDASGLIPEQLVDDGSLSRWGSLDPSEGGSTSRVQGKLQVDWSPNADGHLMANAYVAWYDLELYSNFTYFLENDDPRGDGIVQRDQDRIYTGGRIEYEHRLTLLRPMRVRAGTEWRFDSANVVLGTQTQRSFTGCQRASAPDPSQACNDDHIGELSVEPYVDAQIELTDWAILDAGLRFAWFRFDGRDQNTDTDYGASNETLVLPKANLVLEPFSDAGVWPSDLQALRDLEVFANFGIGYHSNDARAVFVDPGANTLPRAIGTEYGVRTQIVDGFEVALDWWWLELEDEFVFVGDEGTTESGGKSRRQGVELVVELRPTDWLWVRGDVAYTSARLVDQDRPVPQAPRFIARAATGVQFGGFAAQFGVRHLGDRYASDTFYHPRLAGHTLLDLAGRYRWRFLEVGVAIENLTNVDWVSSEFYYESRPVQGGGASDDFHFAPGNSINARGWVTAYF